MNTFSHIFLHMPVGDLIDRPQYVQSLCREIERVDPGFEHAPLASIYIAGGVDCWSEPLVLDTSGTLVKMFVFSNSTECTIEITGKSSTSSQLSCWQKSGVNRISIGTMHFKDTMQKADFYSALKNYSACLSQVGSLFTNINV